MNRSVARLHSVLLAVAAASGCSRPPAGSSENATTYWADVAPILQARCVACHTEPGLAPFPLTSYSSARAWSSAIAAATSARHMPPWQAGPGCGTFKGNRSLAVQEIETLARWNAEGAPEGTRVELPPLPAPDRLRSADLTLDVGFDYQPQSSGDDDYHCFAFDPQLTAERDVTGVDVRPGNAALVHHVILFEVPAASAAALQARTGGSSAGYTCFGDAGVAGSRWVAAWVPGNGVGHFPEGTGVRLSPGSQLVMQVHYNLLKGRGATDRTRLDLEFAPAPVANPAMIAVLPNLLIRLPPGDPDIRAGLSFPILPGLSGRLWGVAGHMHLLGKSFHLAVRRASGERECLLDIPRWDFHWQEMYFFEQPVALRSGDLLEMTCSYDNSAENQPEINGVKAPPREVTFGEGTLDEMCLGLLFLTL